jgi:beta-fructofuranosidase
MLLKKSNISAIKYIWDSWFVKDENDIYHAFYLQSDKNIENHHLRHHNNVSIGHATSANLNDWQEHPVALEPGNEGEWDDLSLWTGSIIQHKNIWYMFYTGRSKSDFWKQQIGLATSKDLFNWSKHDGPILPPDFNFYSKQKGLNKLDKPPAWRDPYIIKDPESDNFFMTITARSNKGDVYNGCVGLAVSNDLINWQVRPPILSLGVFDEMEVTQVIYDENRVNLLFSTYENTTKPNEGYKQVNGLYGFISDKINGKYEPINKDNGLILNYKDKIYDLRLIRKKENGSYLAIGWNNLKRGEFVGSFSKTYSVNLRKPSLSKALSSYGGNYIKSILKKIPF